MKKFELLRFKNMMLLSNALANIVGVSIVVLLSRGVMRFFPSDVIQTISASHRVFLPFSFLIPILCCAVLRATHSKVSKPINMPNSPMSDD